MINKKFLITAVITLSMLPYTAFAIIYEGGTVGVDVIQPSVEPSNPPSTGTTINPNITLPTPAISNGGNAPYYFRRKPPRRVFKTNHENPVVVEAPPVVIPIIPSAPSQPPSPAPTPPSTGGGGGGGGGGSFDEPALVQK